MRYRKAAALFHYAILIVIVTLALAAMNTYLRRSIQAKVKDLTDNIISDKQLASLNDPETETSTSNIDSSYNLKRAEGAGGAVNLNTDSYYSIQMEREYEDPVQVDYGQSTKSIDTSVFEYTGYEDSSSQTEQ